MVEHREDRPPGEPVEALVEAAATGDPKAWQALAAALTDRIEAIARSHEAMRARGLASLPDDIADVLASSLERLSAGNFKNLGRYLEQRAGGQTFDSWLYGAVDFAIREHLRKRYGRAPRTAPDAAPPQASKRDLGTNAQPFDEERAGRAFASTLGLTAKLTAAEIFEHIAREFEATEARALQLYYAEERSLAEIAEALELADERAADKLIRRLNARLRYKFAGDA